MPNNKSIDAALELCKDPSKILGLTFGDKSITPGQFVPQGESKEAPELSFNNGGSATEGKTYLVICLDLDPPFPSWAFFGPGAHWNQPNLTPSPSPSSSSSTTTTKLTLPPNTPFIIDYVGPRPPPPSAPHRYLFILYEQPAGFQIQKWAAPGGKKVGIWPRVRYDLAAFEQQVGLEMGGMVASNWFLSK